MDNWYGLKREKGLGRGKGEGGRFEGWRSVENQLKIAMDDLLLDACATHLQFDCPIGEFGIIAGWITRLLEPFSCSSDTRM
jgi:hypothetical protein